MTLVLTYAETVRRNIQRMFSCKKHSILPPFWEGGNILLTECSCASANLYAGYALGSYGAAIQSIVLCFSGGKRPLSLLHSIHNNEHGLYPDMLIETDIPETSINDPALYAVVAQMSKFFSWDRIVCLLFQEDKPLPPKEIQQLRQYILQFHSLTGSEFSRARAEFVGQLRSLTLSESHRHILEEKFRRYYTRNKAMPVLRNCEQNPFTALCRILEQSHTVQFL